MTPATRRPIQTRISPDILDTIGASFRFSHGKGIAEWMKNSLDNYLRLRDKGIESLPGSWPILLSLIDGQRGDHGPNLAVIDFGGTTFQVIADFFLHWGDRSAAMHGASTRNISVTGGHGNGGKFYMREMWLQGARLLTWRDGKATSVVVEKRSDGTTGMWEMEDIAIPWNAALEFALSTDEHLGGSQYVINYLQEHKRDLLQELDNGTRGFTVIVGRRARVRHSSNDVVSGAKWYPEKLVDAIRSAPQARRPIRELEIAVFVNSELKRTRLAFDPIDADSKWREETIPVPCSLIADSEAIMNEATIGTLTLRKAEQELAGRHRHLNSLLITDGSGNPIAYYSMRELPFTGNSSLITFIHGELCLSYQGVDDLVQNDREKLVESGSTNSILSWVAEQFWSRLSRYEELQRSEGRKIELEFASALNKALNDHSKRFLEELETEMLVDFTEQDDGGGPGAGGEGIGPTGDGTRGQSPRNRGQGGTTGPGGAMEQPGSQEKVTRPRFPRILLSGFDPDPSRSDGEPKYLTEGHPTIHQDQVDIRYNVWWINTEHPFAKQSLQRGGAKSPWFKNYQLSMFMRVVEFETLRIRERRESELAIDDVQNVIQDTASRFLAELPRDLLRSLLADDKD